MTMTPRQSIYDIIDHYDAIWFDAWGVLCDGRHTMPGASQLLAHLDERRVPWRILTNDASSTLAQSTARFIQMGFPITAAQIISAGSVLAHYFDQADLRGARSVVLGPEGSVACAQEAGATLVPRHEDFDVLLVMDEGGFPFLEGINQVLTSLFRALDAGRTPHLLLPNPDVIYPVGGGTFALTAGGIAAFFEAALLARYGTPMPFTRLGKPFPPMFEAAAQQTRGERVLMVGDQIPTDIRGANGFGVDSALLLGGVSHKLAPESLPPQDRPTWIISSLQR